MAKDPLRSRDPRVRDPEGPRRNKKRWFDRILPRVKLRRPRGLVEQTEGMVGVEVGVRFPRSRRTGQLIRPCVRCKRRAIWSKTRGCWLHVAPGADWHRAVGDRSVDRAVGTGRNE